MNQDKFADEFLKGQKDCQEGKPAQPYKSDWYKRGYAAQYQHEQNMEALTRGH